MRDSEDVDVFKWISIFAVLYAFLLFVVYLIVDFDGFVSQIEEFIRETDGFFLCLYAFWGVAFAVMFGLAFWFECVEATRGRIRDCVEPFKKMFDAVCSELYKFAEFFYWKYLNYDKDVIEKLDKTIVGPIAARKFCGCTKAVLYLIRSNRMKFVDFVDLYKNKRGFGKCVFGRFSYDSLQNYRNGCLRIILEDKKLLLELIAKNVLTSTDVQYLFERLNSNEEGRILSHHDAFIVSLIENKLCTFQDIVRVVKNIREDEDDSCLSSLLCNFVIFNTLLEQTLLDEHSLIFLLNNIDSYYELNYFCSVENEMLIKKVLTRNLLDFSLINRYNSILSKRFSHNEITEYNFFNMIYQKVLCKKSSYNNSSKLVIDEETNKFVRRREINPRLLVLLNRAVSLYVANSFEKLNFDERKEIAKITNHSEKAKKKLLQIVNSNLQDQYDFETLKNLLTKEEKKKRLKLNF